MCLHFTRKWKKPYECSIVFLGVSLLHPSHARILHSVQIFLYVLFQSLLPVIFSHLPAGTSWKSFLHYFQEMIAGKYALGHRKSFQTTEGASIVDDSSLMGCDALFGVNNSHCFEKSQNFKFSPQKSI